MSERRQIVNKDAEPNDAVAAFTMLTGEVALLRRVVEQLSTVKAEVEIPDYSLTLGEIAERLDAIESKPAMTITPEDFAARINRAAEAARRTDAATIDDAQKGHRQATHEIWSLVSTMRGRDEQRLDLQIVLAGGIAAGCLLWSILPGVVLRALPASWHMPENMARHIIGEPTLWEAGIRLMEAENPRAWRVISDSAEMRRANRDAIAKCERAATKTRKAVRCTIRVEHPLR